MTRMSAEALAQHWATIQTSWGNPTADTIARGYESAGVIMQCAHSRALCDGVVTWFQAMYFAAQLMRLEGPAGQVPGWWNTVQLYSPISCSHVHDHPKQETHDPRSIRTRRRHC
jgi:hypothetical protein